MEHKVRFKMHKVKKNWVTIGVTALSMAAVTGGALMSAPDVQADELDNASLTGSDSQDMLDVSDSSQANSNAQTEVGNATSEALSDENSHTVALEVAESTPATIEAREVAEPAVSPNNTTSNTENTENTSDTETGYSGFRIANRGGGRRPAPGRTSRPSNPSATVNAGNTTTTTNNQPSQPTSPNTNNTATLTNPSQPTTTVVANQGTEHMVAEELNGVANVKVMDGKQYYLNEDGSVRKNFALEHNGKTYYFDAQTGALVNTSQDQFSTTAQAVVKDFATGNQLYSNDAASLDQLDTFITADAWYRPKGILKDGTTWTASTETDKRPLLMVWWPDKETQVNYLNYMQNQGLGAGQFSSNNSQAELNAAAQAVQTKIEARISAKGNTDWLRETINSFIKTQPNWNKSTENDTSGNSWPDHLQGGQFLFNNSKGDTGNRTSYANSDYRLLNRTPTNQTGERKYFRDNSIGGLEFLLANDVDNSNPAVQAEQLNWLHFIMNIGTIMANDPTANFDGLRVDALDNVDADLVDIASDYFKAHYGVAKSEEEALKHISYLEAWSANDPYWNKDRRGASLPIDNQLRETMTGVLMRNHDTRMRSGNLQSLIDNSINPRSAQAKNGERMANYIFTRAHDTEAQTIIQRIIRDRINPKAVGYSFTMDEINKAFEIYNEDIWKAKKTYASYNLPSVYALMLTNKDSVTRVYYGDLYMEDGHYMAKKTPYYDAIDTLLRARIKYVAGGQDMERKSVGNDGILTSVRYGKGAENRSDRGTAETRTQGMGIIMTNNEDFRLNQGERVTMNMGMAHRNQAYRPLLLTTQDGITTYLNDSDVPANLIKRTDANGNLTFDASEVFGVENVQISGYLGVWVPVGAPANQDARTAPSKKAFADGQVYQSTAALDSQVIYEAFSNFQAIPHNEPEQYMNRVLAKNVSLLKGWGITSVGLPPQYVSSQDGTFLDSTIDNGYAFDDRYDIAMSQNNKYGSLDDLLNVLRALHSQGIQAVADWVPDQIYNLPGKEVVNVTRVNGYGNHQGGYQIIDQAYVANTRTDGTDYQGKYGGAFLDELKAKYPAIFNRVQASNGKQLPTDEKITQWSAKYFNGTNILDRGAKFVLRDNNSNQYFNTSANNTLLPEPLRQTGGTTATQSFQRRGSDVYFVRDGKNVTNEFVQDANGNWYYFGADGKMVRGQQTINGKSYYFFDNGSQLKGGLVKLSNGQEVYYDQNGQRSTGGFVTIDQDGSQAYIDPNGNRLPGLIKRGDEVYLTIGENGRRALDTIFPLPDGNRIYITPQGQLGRNIFAMDRSGNWYYFDKDGKPVTGAQTINGQDLYFEADGRQVKGRSVTINGQTYYYDANTGQRTGRGFVQVGDNKWSYFKEDGTAAKGLMTIDGRTYAFDDNGIQIKGGIYRYSDKIIYLDADSGERLTDGGFREVDGKWYYFRKGSGDAYRGRWRIDGKEYYFDADGAQVKGASRTVNGRTYYYDAFTGEIVKNRFIQVQPGVWSYFNAQGQAVTGAQTINGQNLYFDQNGHQVKGAYATVNGQRRYYDADSGEYIPGR